MAMTGRTVANGMALQVLTSGAMLVSGDAGKEDISGRAQVAANRWAAPLVAIIDGREPGPTLLNTALIRVRVPRERAGSAPKGFTITLAWLSTGSDAFVPDEILESVDWNELAENHAVPLDEGQTASGRHSSTLGPLG